MTTLLDRMRVKASEILWRLRDGSDVEGIYRTSFGELHKEQITNGAVLVRYGPNGKFSYGLYRQIQQAGNEKKILIQSVSKNHIRFLCQLLTGQLKEIRFGICHGTRSGAEQRWFRANLPSRPRVIGTEISDTAAWFRNTVQWDFHESNPDWVGRADFVYSNSWDHAYDPIRAFRVWAESLRPGGVMLLDHTPAHLPSVTTALDPFGADLEALVRLVAQSCCALGSIETLLSDAEHCNVVVFRRHGGPASDTCNDSG